jgi:hypothetical protein
MSRSKNGDRASQAKYTRSVFVSAMARYLNPIRQPQLFFLGWIHTEYYNAHRHGAYLVYSFCQLNCLSKTAFCHVH